MTKRNSTRDRRICFDANKFEDENGRVLMTCHICKIDFDPTKDEWAADHYPIPYEWGGTETLPAHKSCHDEKTNKTDKPSSAKAKRVSDRHYGIKRSSRPMAGGKWSRFKKKLNGEVVGR